MGLQTHLDGENADTIQASFDEGDCACHVVVTSGEGDHKLTLQHGGKTIDLTAEQGLAIRNAINRGRLFAKHQGALKFQRLERAEKLAEDIAKREQVQADKEQREKEHAAERARLQAEEANRRAEQAKADADAAARASQPAAVDPASVPPAPLSTPEAPLEDGTDGAPV